MASWQDITRDPDYQNLSDEAKFAAKRQFFERVIAADAEFASLSPEAKQATFEEFLNLPDDTGQGYVTSLLGSAARGFGEVVPGAVEGVGAITGIEGLREAGQGIRSGLESITPVNPLYQQEVPMQLSSLGGQIGSVLATGGVGGALGKALGGVNAVSRGAQGALLGSAFLQGAAEGRREAEQYGMEGPEAYLRGLTGGAIEAGTEFLPFGMAAETALAKRMLAGAPKTSSFLGAAGSEFGEEGLGKIASNIATQNLAPAGVETPGIMEGALENALYGAAGGAMLGGINALIPSAPKSPEIQIAAEALNATTDTPFTDISGQAAADTIAQNTELAMRMPVQSVEAAEEIAPEVTPSLPEAGPPVVDQEAPAGTPVQAAPIPEVASMPMMVTRDMKQQLVDLGYSKSDINAMRPEEAAAIIRSGVSKPAPIQPITTQEDAIQEQIPDEGVLRQERPEMELQGMGEQNVQPEKVAGEGVQEEVIAPQAEPTTATEGMVTPGGVATERDLTKPEQMTPGEWDMKSRTGITPSRTGVMDEQFAPLTAISLNEILDRELPFKTIPRSRITAQGRGTNPKAAQTRAANENKKIQDKRDERAKELILRRLNDGYLPNPFEAKEIVRYFPDRAYEFFDAAGYVRNPSNPERYLGEHALETNLAVRSFRPVSAAAVDTYGIKLPEGYVKQGDLYVFQPQTTQAAETQTPESVAVDSGAAGVVQSEPSRGSILEVEKESTKTAIESTGKSARSGYGEVVNSARKSLKERPADFKAQEQVLSDLMKLPVADLQSVFEVVTGSPTKLANKRQLANNVLNELLAEAQESKPTAAEDTFRKAEQEAEEEIQRQNAQSIANLFDKLRTNPQAGQVTRADVNQAIGALQNSGEVPNAIFTWTGTTDDLLRQRSTMENQFPGAVAYAERKNIEGVFENGVAFVFTNRVVVTDLDRRKAVEENISPSIAAAKRVITHENMHKGIWLLSPQQKSMVMALLRQMFPASELDELAKIYRSYSDWRTNPVHESRLLDERLQKYIEETKTIPTDGVWKQFWDYIKEIWRKWTGQPKGEPTLQSMKDVIRLIRSALKNAHKARPDRTIDGGRVLMSVSGGRSFVPAVNIDGRVEIGASHYDAWIKHALRQIPNFKKDGLSDEERRQLADRWIVDHPEFMAYSLRKEGFVSDGEFLNRQDSLKKFKSLGGVQQMAPGEPDRDWLDASDVEGYRFSIAPSPSLPDLKANIQRELDAENEEALKKLVPQSITVLTLEDHVDLDDDGLPSKYYLMTVGGADEAVAMLRSGMPRDQFVWMESSDKSSDKQAVSELGEILFDGFLDKKAFKDVQVNRATVPTYGGEVSGAMFSISPVSYASEQDEASSIGQQTARYAASSPRTIEAIVGVRQAYAAMPKSNGAVVMLDDLFAETAKLAPNLTRPEFDRVIQGMYDDNAALLNDAQNPSSVTILPGAMMSMATNEEEKSAAAKFKSAITAAAKGLPDLREYEGRLVKAASGEAIDVEPHNVLWFDGFMKASEQLLSDLQKQGLSLQQIYDKVAMDTEFKRELGLFDEETGSGQAATVLSGLLLQRTLNAARKARTAEAKAQGDALHRKAAAYYSALATARGQNLLMYRLLQSDPRTRFAFMEDKVTREMLKKAEHGVNVQFGDGYAATQETVKNAVDASAEAAKTEVADAVENAAEEDQDAIDLAEGEATLTGKLRELYEQLKDLLRENGVLARLDKEEQDIGAKMSISPERRSELANLTKEERAKLRQKNEAKIEEILKAILGEESEAKTPEQKTTRKKREKMVKTAQKRAEKGQDIDAKAMERAAIEMAENKASQIVYRFEELYRQGFKNPPEGMSQKKQKDSIIKAFREQVKNPTSFEVFVERLENLKVGAEVAERLFLTASRERADLIRMKGFKAEKRKVEIADKQASRLIYSTEERLRQGSKDLNTSKDGDSINKAFREQVESPMSESAFTKRLAALNVSTDAAARMFKTAAREKADQEAMLAYEFLSGPDAFKKMAREVNAMRPSAEVPFMKRIPWREILRQPGKTVEEYRQRIFNAVNSNEAFKDLDEAQKRRLSELFAEAWQSQRDKILASMIEQHTYSLERQQKKEAAKALRDARNQIIEAVNLGAFSNDELTRVLGEKFGFKTSFTEDEKQKLSDLAEKLQDEKLNKAKRNKLAREFLSTLQSGTQIPIAELLSNWWVSAVLSGGNTVSAIASSFLNGTGIGIMGTHLARALRELMKGNTANAIDAITSLFKAYAEHISSFPTAANRAWQYLWSGDVSFLESAANDPFGRVNTLADIAKYQVVADQVAKDPNKVKAVMGRFMQFMGRLLTALDAFNVMVTKAGTVSLAIRQSGLTPEQIRDAELKNDLKFYKDKIVREDPHFGGKQPTSAKEKAYLNSLAEAEMYADLAEMGVKMENADYLASESAMTMNPTGVGGIVYNAIKALDAKVTEETRKHLQMAEIAWAKNKTVENATILFAWRAINFAAEQGLNAFGLRFARFAGNKFNQSSSFVPGFGLLRMIEADNKELAGRQEAFKDTILRNQTLGWILMFAGWAIIKAIEEEPDDEKRGWFLNGGWNNLTPDQKKQKLSKGEKQYTLGIGDYVFNYQNWPISQPLAALGELSDLIRYSQDKWKAKTTGGKAGSAVISGMQAALEIPALTQVGEIFGNTMAAKDPAEQTVSRISRVTSGWLGGFMPRILKDLDYIQDPTMRRYETLFQKVASHVPVYRRYVGSDYYDILGNKIEKNAIPGSRDFMKLEDKPEYRMLGALNARGIWLTPANAEYRMVGKGRFRRRLTQEEADRYSLETGKLYRQMVMNYGPRALQMPVERAKDYISAKADDMRDLALQRAVRN